VEAFEKEAFEKATLAIYNEEPANEPLRRLIINAVADNRTKFNCIGVKDSAMRPGIEKLLSEGPPTL